MSFSTMFFNKRNGKNFFQANDGSPDNKTLNEWVSTFTAETQKILHDLISQKDTRTKVHSKEIEAQQTEEYGNVRRTTTKKNTISYIIRPNKPSTEAVSNIVQLNQINPKLIAEVNTQYEKMFDELIEFILRGSKIGYRSRKELHSYYDTEVVTRAQKLRKSLSYPKFNSFDEDLAKYGEGLKDLLNLYIRPADEANKLNASLLNLYMLLMYQAMHPGVFDEALKEKIARNLANIATFTAQVLVMLSFVILILTPALLPLAFVLTEQLLMTQLLFSAISALVVAAEVYGLSSLNTYIDKNTEYTDVLDYVGNQISKFFFSATELVFNCQIFELAMTRTLEKGKNYQPPEQADASSELEDKPAAAAVP